MAMSMTSTSPPADTEVTQGGSTAAAASAPAARATATATASTRTMAPMPERRAGSSRVRRPPKHLRSPSPPPPPQAPSSSNNTTALAAMQSLLPSSSSSLHLATSANHKMPSAAAAANGTASKKRQPSVNLVDGNETSNADSRRRSRPSGASRPRQSAQHQAASQPSASSTPRAITKVRVRLPVKPLVAEQSSTGYESDGGRVAPLPSSASAITAIKSEWDQDAEAEADADADVEGDFEAIAPPPLIFQRSRAASRRTSGAPGERKRPARMTFRHARTKSMPSIGAALPAWQQRQGRSSLELADQQSQLLHHHSYSHPLDRDDGHISTAETSDGEEENDFHRAMLDGDFDDDYAWTQAVAGDDTPATTPRSPQSMCEPMSAAVAEEKEGSDEAIADKQGAKEAAAAAAAAAAATAQDIHDAVFSRALPSSSRRVQSSHAGSLTLSLPYDESTPVKKEHDDGLSSVGDGAHRHTIARFSTPTLRRTASRARLSQQEQQRSITRPSQAGSGSALTGETTSPTTSPPMSPTRALMGLAAPLSSSAASKALTAAAAEAAAAVSLSVTSSPFLAAVHHHASLSRPASPLPTFQLPDAVVAAPTGVVTSSAISRHASPLSVAGATAAASPTSTHRDLTDVSPFPVARRSPLDAGADANADLLDEDELDLSASRSRHEGSDDEELDGGDGSTPLTTYSSPGADDDEGNAPAVFGLPETMDMSAIDVAYGGTGEVACEEPEEEEEEEEEEEQPQAVLVPLHSDEAKEQDAIMASAAPSIVEEVAPPETPERTQPAAAAAARRGRTSVKRSIEEAAQDDADAAAAEDANLSGNKSARTTPEPATAKSAISPPLSKRRNGGSNNSSSATRKTTTPRSRRDAAQVESPTAGRNKSARAASPSRTTSTRTTRTGGGAANRPRRSR